MKNTCTHCGKPALFSTAKSQNVRADDNHDLCDRCFNAMLQPLVAASPRPRYRADNPKRVMPHAASESLTAKVMRAPVPVNRLAATVIGPGTKYLEREFRCELLSDVPLPTRPYPQNSRPQDDLTGQVFGRLTAIGMSEKSASWVVRCTCGRYCIRKSKTLRAGMDRGGGMCSRCDFEEGRRAGIKGHNPVTRDGLHSAALPMYEALREIITEGLNPATRAMAEFAIAFVHRPMHQSKEGAA